MTTAASSTPAVGTYQIDETGSSIGFVTKHRFNTGEVRGSFTRVGGRIVVAEPETASTVEAWADTTSFTTDKAQRDKHVKSKTFLHAEQFPKLSFHSTEFAQRDGSWWLRGQLTVRDHTGPQEFKVTQIEETGGSLHIRATATANRYEHGVTKMKGMAGKELQLDLDIVATRE